jgi:predicted  nucleic acid-binding Zn-ribbon protein
MQALDNLSQNVHLLLERYEALQQENAALREDVERQRQELIRTHSELLDLQQKNRRIATANALVSAETSEDALKRINALIAQVDRAIAALKR